MQFEASLASLLKMCLVDRVSTCALDILNTLVGVEQTLLNRIQLVQSYGLKMTYLINTFTKLS